MSRIALVSLFAILTAAPTVHSAPLTASDAVRIALQHSTQMVQAQANVLTGRSGLWSAYSGVLPSLSVDASRTGSFTDHTSGYSAFGSVPFPSSSFKNESYRGNWGLTGNWNVLDVASLSALSSARAGMRSAQLSAVATRHQVVLATKRQFYEVVKAIHLSTVSGQTLKLARDNERRVRALYEVGSVSKSDLLQAKVNTSQSVVDSLVADHNVTGQRILLSEQMGIAERDLGALDTTLAATPTTLDPAAVLAEARASRPDLKGADADVRASELGLRAANWARLPFVSVNGSYTPLSRAQSRYYADTYSPLDSLVTTASESRKTWSGSVSVNLNLFTGFQTESRIASARGRLEQSRATRDALVRNLESEVRQALLGYQEAVEREALARSSVESASENLNLVQQKYNVGSATILDLITSQVQLQKAESDLVSALAGIREAEAQLDQVRGRGE